MIHNRFDKKANEILQVLQETPAAIAAAPILIQAAPWVTALFSVLVGGMVAAGGGAWAPPIPTPTETDIKPGVDKDKPKTYPPLVPPIPTSTAPDVVDGTPEISAPSPSTTKTPDVIQPAPSTTDTGTSDVVQPIPTVQDTPAAGTVQNVQPAEITAAKAAAKAKDAALDTSTQPNPVVVPPPSLNFTKSGDFKLERPEEGAPDYQSLTPYAMGQSYTDNSNLSPNNVWKQVLKGKQPIEELPADMQSPEEVAQRFKKWKADQKKKKYEAPGAFGGLVGEPNLD